MLERVQKILSGRGICSRRKAEEYITQGLVLVNGKPAILGQKADPEVDEITLDGKVVEARKELLYYLMHKPVGVVTSNVVQQSSKFEVRSPKEVRITNNQSPVAHSPTVRDLLPPHLQGKIFPIGRLDKDTSGLLLFSNDGVLAYRLTHPRFDHEKEYEVVTETPIKDGQLTKLERGVMIDEAKTKPAKVRRVGPSSFRIAITEGRNRQIRRMCQKVGAPVKHLRRIRITSLTDPNLPPGKIRLLTNEEKKKMLESVGL